MKEFDRLPPHSIEAEMCVLSAVMVSESPTERRKLLRSLVKDDFYQIDHQIIFESLTALDAAGGAIDAVILRNHLLAAKRLEEVGGTEYLARILNTMPSAAHGPHYAEIVKRNSSQRRAITIANQVLRDMYDGTFDAESTPESAIGTHAEAMWRIARSNQQTSYHQLAALLDEAVRMKQENPEGMDLLTGVDSLDRYAGILSLKATTVIGARPSMGKSTFTRWLLSLLAERGVRCGLIAVEESKEKVGRNYLSQYSGVENSRVRSATLGEEEWNAVLSARESAGRLPIIVTDEPQTCEQAVAAIETMANEYQCGVIAVDHIQRLSLRGNWTGRKVEEVTRMSMMLTSAFKRQGVCGIIVSQLNRPEQKHVEPPPPQMADLRESGAIEQDADAILLLHRSDYYHKGDSRWTPTGKMKVVIAKSRDGKTGWLTLKDELKYQRFADLSQTEQMIAGAAGDSDGEDVPNFK